MFLTLGLVCVVAYYLIGIIANLACSYYVIGKLGRACEPYPGLLGELYSRHFLHERGTKPVYKKRSVFTKFLITQTLWPLNVAQTFRKGADARQELEMFVQAQQENRDHSETSSVSARDQNNS